jgi:type I restriction enzyme S subunit
MAGRYKPYPEYKDTGVEWLGSVPLEWEVTKLKYTASIFGRIGFRGYTVSDIVDEGDGAVVLSPSNIDGDRFTLEKRSYLSWNKYYESPEIMVCDGDVLMVKTGSTFGKSTIVKKVDEPMTINPQMALIKHSKLDSRYLTYLLNSNLIKAKIDVSNTGSGMPTMTQENMNGFPVPKPSDELATHIANFLDYETAKIDALIEKQQQLIQLLKEKRQAVISHAVTKGLNPNAKMRDSGVEWLGEVPEHWAISPIKWYASIKSGESFPANEIESTKDEDFCYPVYGGNGILGYAKEFNLTNAAIVIGRVGALCGNVHRVTNCSWVSDNALIMNIDFSVFSFDYISLCLSARDLNELADKNAQPLITGTKVMNERVPVPPVEEQHEIAGKVTEMMKQFEVLSAQAELGIALLQERRTALISAAVTGKIDVRNWAAPKEIQTNKEVVNE